MSSSNSSRQPVGGAAALLPADHPLLLEKRRAVPRLDAHPDPAADQIGAAGHPVRPVTLGHPHLLVEHAGVLGLDVVGSVLEAEQVSRRGLLAGGRRGAAEPELGVAHRDGPEADPRQVADRVHGHLRVVGAGLHDDVAAAASRVQRLVRELRQGRPAGRASAGDSEAVLAVLDEEARPEPDGQRQLRGRQPQRFAGIRRRRIGIEPDRTVVDGLVPGGHPLGHRASTAAASRRRRPWSPSSRRRWRSASGPGPG